MKRREFIKGTAMLAAASGISSVSNAANVLTPEVKTTASVKNKEDYLIASAPMLQNYAATSMGIAFAVSDMANGYVIYGEKPDLSDGQKVKCGGYRVTDISDKVIQVRLTGLKPATTYYYDIFPAASKTEHIFCEFFCEDQKSQDGSVNTLQRK